MHNSCERNSGEPREDLKVLSFDEGLQKAVGRIQDLISTQSVAAVGIDGSNTNVGKTRLVSRLARELSQRQIPVVLGSEVSMLHDNLPVLPVSQAQKQSTKAVILIENAGLQSAFVPSIKSLVRNNKDRELRELLERFNIMHPGYDFMISIYRPDKPFSHSDLPETKLLGDIVICNDNAIDDHAKYASI